MPNELTEEAVYSAAYRLLNEAAFRATAESLRAEIHQMPSPDAVANIIAERTGQIAADASGPLVGEKNQHAHQDASEQGQPNHRPEPVDAGRDRRHNRRAGRPPTTERAKAVGDAGAEGPVTGRAHGSCPWP